MRLRVYDIKDGQLVEVVLSRRNLAALLHKLEMPSSMRTLVGGDGPEGLALVVRCEEDDEHYGGRDEPPGVMHPGTETFIAERPRRRAD